MAVTSVDVEPSILAWLAARTGARCVTELPSDLIGSVPLIEVGRIGGSDRVLTMDAARVDITCFAAAPRDNARKLAYQVHDLLRLRLPGTVVPGGVVLRVLTESGPTWLPYDNTSVRRFAATYEITVHSQQ